MPGFIRYLEVLDAVESLTKNYFSKSVRPYLVFYTMHYSATDSSQCGIFHD